MSTEEEKGTTQQPRAVKVIPSIKRENTNQDVEKKPYTRSTYNRADNGERRSYNRPYQENREGGNSYGRQSQSYGNRSNTNQPYREGGYAQREGGYNRDRNYQRGYQSREGGYQPREGGYQPREGGYQPREGGYQPREGGYQPREGGYQSREGGYQPREGGAQSREGGYNRNSYGNRQGGYQSRSYGNQGGSTEGGYNRNSYGNNYQNRPYSPQGEDGGDMRKRRPRVGDSRPNSYGGPRQGGYSNNRDSRSNSYGSPRQGGYTTNSYQRPSPNYNPNAKYGVQKQLKYKEKLADPNAPIRLNKFLANAGVCSRREADELIKNGAIKVNGVVITELGTKITRQDKVVHNREQVYIESKLYVLLNKPKNCVTTSDDPQERLTVMDLVKNACTERIYPVGRLDRNTTGVLLLTNDGDLASKLTHPQFKKKKIYHVWLDKDITVEDLAKIADGIELEDGEIHADAISYATEDDRKQVGIEIHSGRNRIVRRIFETMGYHVKRLDRVYFAGLTKKNLSRGRWRYLNEKEVNQLRMGAFE
ncbi:MAG: pseudouridine synthase [Massilibacteroides sp.]|nr:pseudouridine synthase [Massilibacteroides sp.]